MPPKRGARGRGGARTSGQGPPARYVSAERPRIVVKPEPLQFFNESKNILIHGNSGVGKTSLAGHAPNAVFLSTEKGAISAKRTGSKAERIQAYDWEHVEAGLDWADKELGPEDWLILDSATKMQILMSRWILKVVRETNENRDEDIPAIQDHQKWQNMYMRFIDRVVDSRYNSIIITTSMHKEDPEGEDLVLPSITGKDYAIANYVCAQMDAVYYLGVAKGKGRNAPTIRRILTEAYPPWFAKDWYGIFERWIDIPAGVYDTMAWMIEEISKDPE